MTVRAQNLKAGRTLAFSVFFSVTVFVSESQAKFLHEDAEEVDRQENISQEYYNDVLSYRYPYPWIENWHRSPMGFRINAGSLNATEFAYQEEARFFFTDLMRIAFPYT